MTTAPGPSEDEAAPAYFDKERWPTTRNPLTCDLPICDATDIDNGSGDARVPVPLTAWGQGPPSDWDPSRSNDDDRPDSDASSAVEDLTQQIDEIKKELVEGITLVLFQYCPPRPQPTTHLHPRVRQTCPYRWDKDRRTVLRDVLDRKGPLATTVYPKRTTEFWTQLFSRDSPPLPDNIVCCHKSLLSQVSLKEIRCMKGTVNKNSALCPDRLKAEDFLTIPDERLANAYN